MRVIDRTDWEKAFFRGRIKNGFFELANFREAYNSWTIIYSS